MPDLKKKLMYKVALAYYEEGLTQQEIGNKYGISRIMVSRLLKKAVNEKLVEIKIHKPEDPNLELEKQLELKYKLSEVLVVTCASKSNEDVMDEIGTEAAKWLINQLEGKEVITLSWGKTLLSLINALPQMSMPELTVVQMIGGLGKPEAEIHGADLTRRMAQAFGTRPRMLSSPGIVKSKVICEALKSDLQISETLNLAAKADIALMGIGVFDKSSPIYSTDIILSSQEKEWLKSQNGVGDISLRFFDSIGQLIKGDLDDRIVGLSMEEIQKIPRRVGIAGGKGKHETIRAACLGKFINVLITDDDSANELLK